MKCRFAIVAAAVAVLGGLACTSRAQGPDAFVLDPSPAGGTPLGATYSVADKTPYNNPTPPVDLISPAPCQSNPYVGGYNPYCEVQTGFDNPCPEGLNCGETQYCPHPGGCGVIELTNQATVSGMNVPFYFGFNNNVGLQTCTLVYNAIQFNQRPDGTTSDGTKLNDTWNFTGNATCTGYGQGVTFSVVTHWAVTAAVHRCYRGCVTTYTYRITGGSGVVQGPN
jgi:hypothetical protein